MDGKQTPQLLRKHEPFTREDLNTLRAGFAESYSIPDGQTFVMARLNLELIDRIIHLDDTSTELINTTNTLTSRILLLTVVGVGVGLVGLILSAVELYRR
jgi:hypothetical protein